MLVFSLVLVPGRALCQNSAKDLCFQLGVYDFTDEVAKEFYGFAPTALTAIQFLKTKHLSLNISGGVSYTSVKYNEKRHNVFMVPLNAIALYTFAEPDTKLRPFIGTGLGLHFKSDKNEWLKEAYNTITYGYIINAGLDIPISSRLIISIDFKYEFFIISAVEALNVSGILSSAGIKIPLGYGKTNKN
jgi:outer membrane protein W